MSTYLEELCTPLAGKIIILPTNDGKTIILPTNDMCNIRPDK
jgi:hypothetical protein